MAINTGDSITAADYNSLQSRVQQVLGQGSQTFGYGQQVKSQQVSGPTATGESNATNITAEEFNNIRDDISRIFIHQTGSALDVGLFKGAGSADNDFQTADEADVIGADQSATSVTVDNSDNYTYTNTDETKGFNNLVEIVSQIESQQNRFKIDSTQQQLQMLEIDRRTNAWNGSIQSEIEVTFTDADQRRYFFNAGGQLRFQGIVTAVSSQRGSFWNDLIENPGEIQFGYNFVQNTGSSTGVSSPNGGLGNYNLSNSYQTVFRKDANSGLYGDSFWQIEAREQTSSSISFRITLVNDGPEGDFDAGDPGSIAGGIQESVAADIEFEYSAMKASGTVVTQFPTINLINSFS
jgi:hypothetical protein